MRLSPLAVHVGSRAAAPGQTWVEGTSLDADDHGRRLDVAATGILDAPDIDLAEEGKSTAFASEPFDGAGPLIFVTSAARYADAV